MRRFSFLRTLALAVALSAPFAQAALAYEQDSSAMTDRGASITPSYGSGPYDSALTAPAVGD